MNRFSRWALAPAALVLCATGAHATAYVVNGSVSFTGTPATGAGYGYTVTQSTPALANVTKGDTLSGTITFDQPFTIYNNDSGYPYEGFGIGFQWDSQPTIDEVGTVTLLGVTGSTTGTTFASQEETGGISINALANLTNSSFSFTGVSYTVTVKSGSGTDGTLSSFYAIGGSAPVAPPASVPEPATWAMMIGGFGMVGAVLRRQRRSDAGLDPVRKRG